MRKTQEEKKNEFVQQLRGLKALEQHLQEKRQERLAKAS